MVVSRLKALIRAQAMSAMFISFASLLCLSILFFNTSSDFDCGRL